MATLLTVDEVADILRKSTKWVYQNKKDIPGYLKIAGAIFFNRETLEKHLVGSVPKHSPGKHGI